MDLHHHHHHHEMAATAGKTLIVGIVLNLLFVVIEAVVGLAYNSLGLLSDAGHNLGDVFGLILAFLAMQNVYGRVFIIFLILFKYVYFFTRIRTVPAGQNRIPETEG